MSSGIKQARIEFHQALLSSGVLSLVHRKQGTTQAPSNADADNKVSVEIALHILKQLTSALPAAGNSLSAQASGSTFEAVAASFLTRVWPLLNHLRPGTWEINPRHRQIQHFDQYLHLNNLATLAKQNPELAALLGIDYLIKPDIVIVRHPEPDAVLNSHGELVDEEFARHTPLRSRDAATPVLHACVSCKWTMRSDRAQNARSEALTLIRSRKGHVPHIAVLTAEPLPSRLASLALGTGDLDCVYHFALPELEAAVASLVGEHEGKSMLAQMIESRRLRDISDLPLDLAI